MKWYTLKAVYRERKIIMHVHTLPLRENRQAVTLTTYLIDDSKEFQTGVKRPLIVLVPGGGYLNVSDREGEPIALKFMAQGYHVAIIRYTTYLLEDTNPPVTRAQKVWPDALYDLAEAMIQLQNHADEWLIDTDKIVMAGFSAGGHLALSFAVHRNKSLILDQYEDRANAFNLSGLILGYPVTDYTLMEEKIQKINDQELTNFWRFSNRGLFGVSEPTREQLALMSPVKDIDETIPPIFIWHTVDDGLVFPENSLRVAEKMSELKRPYELYMFEEGVHGLSLADHTSASYPGHINEPVQVWFSQALKWLKRHGC